MISLSLFLFFIFWELLAVSFFNFIFIYRTDFSLTKGGTTVINSRSTAIFGSSNCIKISCNSCSGSPSLRVNLISKSQVLKISNLGNIENIMRCMYLLNANLDFDFFSNACC